MPKLKPWILKDILLPFFVTRFLLVLSGLFAPSILPFNPTREDALSNLGQIFSNSRLIDMWARWDSGWYLSVVNWGYYQSPDVTLASNLPFFPLFPAVVKLLGLLVPQSLRTSAVHITIGLVVSNLALIGSLILLYKIAEKIFAKKNVGKMVVWAVLVFPSSFFLSSFYSESLYLFLSLLTYWYALQRKWMYVGLYGALLSAARMLGVMVMVPVLFEYFSSIKYDLRKLNWNVLWLGLIPTGLLSFYGYLYTLTGDFLISLKSHAAWGRSNADPVTSFLFPTGFWWYVTPLDQLWVISGLVLSIQMVMEKLGRLKVLGLYALALLLPALFTGTLDSFSRIIVVIFPLFLYWSYVTRRNQILFWTVNIVFMVIQILYFGLFSQFYWVA